MITIRASVTAEIAAPASAAYGLIADYLDGHPRILPPRVFGELVVERGGIGAGTRIRCRMTAFGRQRMLVADITEPEPGRRLVETDAASDLVTSFTVDPVASGAACRVTIATEYRRAGLAGWLERLFVPPFLRAVYRDELALLEREAQRAVRS